LFAWLFPLVVLRVFALSACLFFVAAEIHPGDFFAREGLTVLLGRRNALYYTSK
jgi:hypothetical protein